MSVSVSGNREIKPYCTAIHDAVTTYFTTTLCSVESNLGVGVGVGVGIGGVEVGVGVGVGEWE
jgi:hypothetical protein